MTRFPLPLWGVCVLQSCELEQVRSPLLLSESPVLEPDPVIPGDEDGDGLFEQADNCAALTHPSANDQDGDGLGDACDPCPSGQDERDSDLDGFDDCSDRCPHLTNPDNSDADSDGIGDACDLCPATVDAHQRDANGDGVGDACEKTGTAWSLAELTVAEIERAIESGEVHCESLIEQVLERIQRFDLDVTAGAPIHAFISFNEFVREQARALDAAFARDGKASGPLHCVPLVIKGNYDSNDTPTTAGSLSLTEVQAKRDGFALARLRKAGALLIGTTNMDEFAMGVFGISSRTGRTGNAHDTRRNPGGSSAGSGAALAAGFAVLGTGTDNCSSLTLPAAYEGLVTIRSTYGLVSLDGVFPSNRLDAVAGPMARTVRDLTLMLDQMAGVDPADSRTEGAVRPDSYLPFLKADALSGKRIGVLRRVGSGDHAVFPFDGADADALHVFEQAMNVMRSQGAELVDNVALSQLSTARSAGGFRADVDAYFEGVDAPYQGFLDVCESQRFAASTYADEASCVSSYTGSSDPDGDAYQRAQARYDDNRAYVETLLEARDLDALLYPVDALGAAHVSDVKSNCVVSSVTGLPVIVIAAGNASTAPPMPIGMQLLGRSHAEPTLLALAYAFEQATQHRRVPVLHGPDTGVALPRFSPRAESELRLLIGEAAFEEVLREGSRSDLSSQAFRELVKRMLALE